MKLFAYILAFYIIGLAAVPCCILDNCPDDKAEQAGHETGDDDCGSCSPFFSCEGCASATIAYQPIQFEFISPDASPVYTVYQQSSLPDADLDFWQPPKLGQ
ncbi:MAG TPA: DUF6660 family protein [Chitinophagaceae bacterium]|nr:DUF6660 family protein [Chitinophagaceae bacterium]